MIPCSIARCRAFHSKFSALNLPALRLIYSGINLINFYIVLIGSQTPMTIYIRLLRKTTTRHVCRFVSRLTYSRFGKTHICKHQLRSFHAHFPQFIRNMKDCWHWALVGTVVPTHTQTVPRRSPVKQCGRWSAFKQAYRSSSSPLGILFACCTAGRPYVDHEAVETAMLYRFCIPPPPSGNDCNQF